MRSLVELPLSKLKLDKSLISELETSDKVAMLVSTLIQWARANSLDVVAEGVETETQATLLRAFGCPSLQGFLFGRAMSAKQFSNGCGLLKNRFTEAFRSKFFPAVG